MIQKMARWVAHATLRALLLLLLLVTTSSGERIKRVLIIGDSISLGYTPFLKELLKEQAEVTHSPGNSRDSHHGAKAVAKWVAADQWDIIYFNWGLWDLCYRHPESKVQGNRDKVNGSLTTTLEEYSANLEQIVIELQKSRAKLIFANTTMVPSNEAGRFPEDVDRYNRAALAVMKRHKVMVDDLNSVSRQLHPIHGLNDADVHYTKEGYEAFAKQIGITLKKQLKRIK